MYLALLKIFLTKYKFHPGIMYNNYLRGLGLGVIPFHFKNDTDMKASPRLLLTETLRERSATGRRVAEKVICISNFVNWYKGQYS
ncbi:hypothetical protein [Nostoc sp. FACHB-280]|uniref:hypothetical protein n=1 Tax=Nostoc sp. FACHB-280 TaxID=2692839 RepID=UPI00168B58BF|nr:hypothetical protein [Nostoc sp. FACHB-280]MBD2493124.1 hypothetical protein [Nostoc sp. FACHB-280]